MAGARIGEVPCPTHYAADSSSISLRRSIRYRLGVLRTCTDYRLHRHGERRAGYLDFEAGKLTALRAGPDAARMCPRPALPGDPVSYEQDVRGGGSDGACRACEK